MTKFGDRYGSECHLLRYLGRHRQELDRKICQKINALHISWLDFLFRPNAEDKWADAEWESLDFLQDNNHPAVTAWKKKWPHGKGIHNWDALGKIKILGQEEWLLVEAKAHTGELRSDCGAEEHVGLPENADVNKRIHKIFLPVAGK